MLMEEVVIMSSTFEELCPTCNNKILSQEKLDFIEKTLKRYQDSLEIDEELDELDKDRDF